MALPELNIFQTDGGIGANPPSNDGISGLIVYSTDNSAGLYVIYTPQDSLTFTNGSSALYYHINEYFAYSSFPLYVSITHANPSTFSEIITLQNWAQGAIRIFGVWNDRQKPSIPTIQSHIVTINTRSKESQTSEFAPLTALYQTDTSSGLANLGTYPSLHTLNSDRVAFSIKEDVDNPIVAALRTARARATTGIGTWLGETSNSLVQDCVGNQEKYNLNRGDAWFSAGLIDGTKISSYSRTQLNAIDDLGYTFALKEVGNSGTFISNSWTCNSITSDFNSIERSRVWQKAFRNLYSILITQKNTTLSLDPKTGNLSLQSIAYLKDKCKQALDGMLLDGEINAYQIGIDSNQKPLQNGGRVQIVAKIQPKGILKFIEVPLGFVSAIS